MADIKAWASKSIGSLLQDMQMSPDDVQEIVDHILTFDDPDELLDFLKAFGNSDAMAEHRISTFVSDLFQRKGVPQDKGKGKGRGKSKSGRDDDDHRRKKKEEHFPTMLMPFLPRDKDDKRLMVIDAASGYHKEITNCLNCGKVIAESEGWGPCLFCGNPLEIGDSLGTRCGDDRGYTETDTTSRDQEYNKKFEQAKATKDRLLSYDRDAKKRTKVYDDATDWYTEASNPWLNEKQREEAIRKGNEEEKKKKEDKRRIHAKIDLFGRTVIDTSAEAAAEMEKKSRETYENWTEKVADENKLRAMFEEHNRGMIGQPSQLSGESQSLYDKLRASLHAAGRQFKDTSAWATGEESKDQKKSFRYESKSRVENEFSDVTTSTFDVTMSQEGQQLLPVVESPYTDEDDKGFCLSMHQPWASLLVYGFKRAEGRSWKHDHRGRLWIHAAAKTPEASQIKELELTYRRLYESQGIPIPKMPSEGSGYPTSALLGCIDMEECFSNDEYTAMLKSNPSLPPEDNDNNFVFWCLRPRRLRVPIKTGGDNKIWRLPVSTMRTAQGALVPVQWPMPKLDDNASTLSASSRPSAPSRIPAPDSPREMVRDEPAIEKAASSSKKNSTANSKAAPAKASTAQVTPQAKEPSPRSAPHLDLWPAEKSQEFLEVLGREKDAADRDVVVLQDGFVHLVGFIPPDVQQQIVDVMRDLGVSSLGFVEEQFDGVKVSKDVSRMYLGMHWNAQTQRWDVARKDLDGQQAAAIPSFLLTLYSEAVKRANRELTRGQNKKRKLQPFVETKAPSIGVVNFFQPSGTMQIHQDRTESKASIDAGYPVLGICIGDSCDLLYSTEQPTQSQKPKMLRLESGDVYLFGGSSRMIWHGVGRVIPRSAPPSLRLLPGRLNVTLRVH